MELICIFKNCTSSLLFFNSTIYKQTFSHKKIPSKRRPLAPRSMSSPISYSLCPSLPTSHHEMCPTSAHRPYTNFQTQHPLPVLAHVVPCQACLESPAPLCGLTNSSLPSTLRLNLDVTSCEIFPRLPGWNGASLPKSPASLQSYLTVSLVTPKSSQETIL